jgi:hypothetical protein
MSKYRNASCRPAAFSRGRLNLWPTDRLEQVIDPAVWAGLAARTLPTAHPRRRSRWTPPRIGRWRSPVPGSRTPGCMWRCWAPTGVTRLMRWRG